MRCQIFLIVAGVLSYAQLQAQCANAPDMVIINANIVTMDAGQPTASALAIRDGIIQAVGETEDILALIPADCPVRWIDADGYTILPGFNDAHSHWLSWPEHLCDAPGQEETTYPPLDVIMDTLSMHGWTSISELNFGRPALIPEHLQHAMELEASGDLHVRINGYWGTYDHIDLLDELNDFGYEAGHVFSDRIRAPGVKMYVDDPFGTMDIMDQVTCTQLVSAAHAAGYQVAAHCVNQSAVEKILTAYEMALGGSNNQQSRHRIEHAVKVSDNQLQRLENKGILLSFQLMGPPDWPEQNTFQTYISNTNTDFVLRWNDFLESNVPTVGSTDAPFNNTVCHYSPFRAMYQAVTRIGYLDRPHAPWELDQRILIGDALELLTLDGAWATKEENIKGSLKAGKYADLTIVSADPLSVQFAEDLLEIKSLMTMVGGEIEYCSPEFPAFCNPPIAFHVDSVIVTVNNYLEDQKPGRAFDLNVETNWSAGDFPPQYIQVDFLKNTALERVELVVDQFPDGFTRHQVLGGKSGEPLSLDLLHEFAGNTTSLQTLVYSFDEGNREFRYVRIATLESPSWVSWREVRFYTKATSVADTDTIDHSRITVFPNLFKQEFTVQLDLKQSVKDVFISMVDIYGRNIFSMHAGDFIPGIHQVVVDSPSLSSISEGYYFVIVRTGNLYTVSNVTKQ